MSSNSQDLETRRRFYVHEIFVPMIPSFITNLIAALALFLLAGVGVYFLGLWDRMPPWTRQWWVILLVFITFLCILIFFCRKILIVRSIRLQIYKEVSASKCSEYFISLVTYYARFHFRHLTIKNLHKITDIRRYPNSHLMQPLERKLSDTSLDNARQPILDYLQLLSERRLTRREINKHVRDFLKSEYLTSDTYLVLYGYSTNVCKALVDLRAVIGKPLPCPVFLLQDLQYGLERSLNEHKKAERHLKKGSITPIILPFHQVTALCSANTDFLRTEMGELVPLARARRVVTLIGCDVCDSQGTALVPSQLPGKPSETAKFVELFSQSKTASNTSSVETMIVVVTEGNKIYEEHIPDTSTYAPVKSSWLRDFLYLIGIDRILRRDEVQFVTIEPTKIHAFIDEYGIHTHDGKDYIDLQPSLDRWYKDKVVEAFPEMAKGDSRTLLKDSEAVIFDLSAILADSDRISYEAMKFAAQRVGGKLNLWEYVEEYSALSDEEALQKLIDQKGLSGTVSEALKAKQEKLHLEFSARVIPFPDAINLIKKLQDDKKKCYFIASIPKEDVENFIVDNALDSVFSADNCYIVVQSADRAKTYTTIVHQAGVNVNKCVLLDYSPSNLATAKELQIKTIGIAMGRPPSAFQADAFIEDVSELFNKYTS